MIDNVEIVEGGHSITQPVIIIDAATAREALKLGGVLEALVEKGLASLELSGKNIVYLEQSE